jgi:transposase
MATILAIDLGKFQSQGCFYQAEDGSHEFKRIGTSPASMHALLVERKVDRVVIEACSMAGWVVDLCEALGVASQVVNCNQDAWRWKNVKNKSDKLDALKLARLSAMNQLSLVHVPRRAVRQWRSLIQYRQTLVERRTAMRNAVHALLGTQGEAGVKSWSGASMKQLKELGKPLSDCGKEELWRGQLQVELTALEQVQGLIECVQQKLDALAQENPRVQLLQSIPGVGPRLAELIVAQIDDPRRFKNARQVGSYAGLTPRRYQSGQSDRSGRISRAGSGTLRKLLVQVAWGMLHHNEQGKAIFDRLCKGQKTRRKQAAVALARRILVWCWAMLRDNRRWDITRLEGERLTTAA